MLKQFLLQYWEKKYINKGEYLYENNKNDTNLYFILKGKILLTISWQDIAIVWENELSWEKSFLNQTSKPIDAKAISDVEVLVLTREKFKSLDKELQLQLLKSLTLFVSDRVYFLNDIINTISKINVKISSTQKKLNFEFLKNLFSEIIDINNIYMYKFIYWWFLPIFESQINPDLQKKINNFSNKKIIIEWWKNSFLIKSYDYLFFLEWKPLKSNYIINNVIMHSVIILKYLWNLLEEEKNNSLSDLLDQY